MVRERITGPKISLSWPTWLSIGSNIGSLEAIADCPESRIPSLNARVAVAPNFAGMIYLVGQETMSLATISGRSIGIMSLKPSAIGWTDFSAGDANFITGCTAISEGCSRCYARRIYERFRRDFSEVKTHPDKLERLARTKFPEFSPKRGAPHKPMVFVVDTGDLFHDEVPTGFILDAFDMMRVRSDVEWLVLTKRPWRMNAVLFGYSAVLFGYEGGGYLDHGASYPNVRLMVSAENQEAADTRIPELLRYWRGPNGVSLEPMLGPIEPSALAGISWCVLGGESGTDRRLFRKEWAIPVRDYCARVGIPFFFKQGSSQYPGRDDLLEAKTYKEWPQ